jgi:hypothetical protein
MNELDKVKAETAERLNNKGYEGTRIAEQIERITGHYNGQPSRVEIRTQDGQKIELYL